MPGAASLLCEQAGRRIVYAGPIGASGADVRAADALCIDATFASSATVFPAREQALAEVGRAVRDVLARGGAPVVLIDPRHRRAWTSGPRWPAIASASARTGRSCRRRWPTGTPGLPAPPLQRFAGKIGAGEALLWPVGARVPPRRAGAREPGIILVSADAGREAAEAVRGQRARAVPDRGRLLRPGPLHRGERRDRGRAGQRPQR